MVESKGRGPSDECKESNAVYLTVVKMAQGHIDGTHWARLYTGLHMGPTQGHPSAKLSPHQLSRGPSPPSPQACSKDTLQGSTMQTDKLMCPQGASPEDTPAGSRRLPVAFAFDLRGDLGTQQGRADAESPRQETGAYGAQAPIHTPTVLEQLRSELGAGLEFSPAATLWTCLLAKATSATFGFSLQLQLQAC
ncbi:hypothetical protein H8959_015529 [Pygathrix nigripes]